MAYYIDLENITLDDYKTKLQSAYLPPSRMILKDNLEERFVYFESIDIENVKQLITLLKKKDKFLELTKVDCFSEHYLKILLRELNSIHPKPNKISDFADISVEAIEKLELIGIRNTRQLYNRIITSEARRELSKTTGLTNATILELTKLTDLSRIKWVGVTFARMLYDLGFDTAEIASKADPIELHRQINERNVAMGYYKGKIGLNDIRIFINAAKEVTLEIKY